MKKFKQSFTLLLAVIMLASVFCLIPTEKVEAKTTVNSVVKNARNYYNDTNSSIKKGKLKKYGRKSRSGSKAYGIEIWKKNGKVRKMILYPNNNISSHVSPQTVEYYYDKNENLVFLFAYDKQGRKRHEYRWYIATNGKIYRYINASKKTYNYSNGKKPSQSGGSNLLWGHDLYEKSFYNDFFN